AVRREARGREARDSGLRSAGGRRAGACGRRVRRAVLRPTARRAAAHLPRPGAAAGGRAPDLVPARLGLEGEPEGPVPGLEPDVLVQALTALVAIRRRPLRPPAAPRQRSRPVSSDPARTKAIPATARASNTAMPSLTLANVRGRCTIQNQENTMTPDSSAASRAVHGARRPRLPATSATPAK